MLRSYEKEELFANEAINVSKDVAFKHMAVFEVAYHWGWGSAVREYLASCVTLTPSDRVLAGNTYNVGTELISKS